MAKKRVMPTKAMIARKIKMKKSKATTMIAKGDSSDNGGEDNASDDK